MSWPKKFAALILCIVTIAANATSLSLYTVTNISQLMVDAEFVAINNNSQVLGHDSTGWFLLDRNGDVSRLSFTGTSDLVALNDNGDFVGREAGGSGTSFIWNETGGVQNLENGENFRANGINNKLQVSGRIASNQAGDPSGAIWANGVITYLPNLFPGNCNIVTQGAIGINELGATTGSTGNSGCNRNATYWPDIQTAQGITDFSGDNSWGEDVNDAASIVGFANDASPTFQFAFLWLNGSLLDLNSLLFDPTATVPHLTRALGISNSGDILAYSGDFSAPDSYFILTPAQDQDSDGVPDSNDNCALLTNSDQRDTDGDGFGNICDADFDQNCVVNFIDLNIIAAFFLVPGDFDTDLNGDGVTNFVDFSIVASSFLSPPGPSGVTSDCD